MGTPGSAVILTAFGNVSCKDNGLAAAFYAIIVCSNDSMIKNIHILPLSDF